MDKKKVDRKNYDKVNDFHEWYAKVKKDDKYNFIDKSWKKLFEKRISYESFTENKEFSNLDIIVWDFHEWYAKILLPWLWNFINKSWELYFSKRLWENDIWWGNDIWDINMWLIKVSDTEDGYSYEYNFFNIHWKKIFEKNSFCNNGGWFIWEFKGWFAFYVQLEEYISSEHPLSSLTTDWEIYYDEDWNSVDESEYMSQHSINHGPYKEKYGRRYKLEIIDTKWNIYPFFRQRKNKKYDHNNVEDIKEGYCYYQQIEDFFDEVALVRDWTKYNFFQRDSSLLFKEWLDFDDVQNFSYWYARVKKDGKYNFINKLGDLLFIEWLNYEYVGNLSEGYIVISWWENKWNFIDIYWDFLF